MMKISHEMIKAVHMQSSERFTLDLRLSAWEGAAGNLGDMVLFCCLLADTHGLEPSSPRLLVLCHDETTPTRLKVSEFAVTEQNTTRLVKLLRAAGFPHRVPCILSNTRSSIGGQELAVDIRLDGRASSLRLTLEYAGFSGVDAGPLRTALLRIAELAAAAGRPAARTIIERLVLDGEPHSRTRPSWTGLPALAGDQTGLLGARGPEPAFRTDTRE
jgi:hypothetical protein